MDEADRCCRHRRFLHVPVAGERAVGGAVVDGGGAGRDDPVLPAPVGPVFATTVWDASWNWALTALPLFIWMGEILFRSRLSEQLFSGLGALGLPGFRGGCCTSTWSVAGSWRRCPVRRRSPVPPWAHERAGALQARLPPGDVDRHPGRFGHARPADSAVDHDDVSTESSPRSRSPGSSLPACFRE